MPRSAADATRFTATGPYAFAKPPAAGSTIALGQGAPTNESPQQKIARLRAAASQAKLGQESQFDKVVRVGRVWADRAHRITAWSLIGLTVVCGVFATFSIGDMLVHNRRKRNEWLEEQQAKTAVLLQEARTAAARGQVLNDDQILLLNRERAAQDAETARKAQKGIFTRAKEAVLGAVAKEEQQGGRIMSEVRALQSQATASAPVDASRVARPSGFLEDVNSPRPAGVSKALTRAQPSAGALLGGPLDRQAAADTAAVAGVTASWWFKMTGR